MTLKLYGVLRSRASRVAWLANELGLEYEHVPVIQAYRLPDPQAADAPLNTASPAFLALNPNGHIPSIDDDGYVLHESLAINLYLAKKHGGALAPRDLAEDGQMAMWALWAVLEAEPHTLAVQANSGKDQTAVDAAIATLRRPFAVLDSALARGDGHLLGGRFTVADINTAEVVRYAMSARALFDANPHVDRWLSACHARPAFKAMMAARISEPA